MTLRRTATQEVIGELWEGNRRFQRDEARGPRRDRARRAEVAERQAPIAAVVACSDSRVPPEILFDQGLGDLFVVRVAGNVVGGDALGSLEYAAEHLEVPVVVILGHSRCGAVGAALHGGESGSPHIDAILAALRPAVEATAAIGGDRAAHAAKEHVRRLVGELPGRSAILRTRVETGRLAVVGAYYDVVSGAVERLEA
jgi:carbonic anhydrase